MIHALVKVSNDKLSYITFSFGETEEQITRPHFWMTQDGTVIEGCEIEILDKQFQAYDLFQARRLLKAYARKYNCKYSTV